MIKLEDLKVIIGNQEVIIEELENGLLIYCNYLDITKCYTAYITDISIKNEKIKILINKLYTKK